MQEFSSVTASSYDAEALAPMLTEKASEGWSVVSIVSAGTNVIAYLTRGGDGQAAPPATTGRSSDASGAAGITEIEVNEEAAAAVAEDATTISPSLPGDESSTTEDEPAVSTPEAVAAVEASGEPSGWGAADTTSTPTIPDSETTSDGDTDSDAPTVPDSPSVPEGDGSGIGAVAGGVGAAAGAAAVGGAALAGDAAHGITPAVDAPGDDTTDGSDTGTDGSADATETASETATDASSTATGAAEHAGASADDSMSSAGDAGSGLADSVGDATAGAAASVTDTANDATDAASTTETADGGGEGSEAAASGVPAGWYADPSGRFELRYWDGSAWTEHVSRAGQQYTDPPVA